MRITKVYTRAGDKGQTRLVGGQKVPKDSLRIESYGTVDELNAILGLVRVANRGTSASEEDRARIDRVLHRIQNDLFNLGSDLATRVEDRWPGQRLVNQADIDRLEQELDGFNDDLPPLKEFILPGGGPVGAQLHQARTVCRRAERQVVALSREEELNPTSVGYLNRLSDYLFVLGRWAAAKANEPESLWDREL